MLKYVMLGLISDCCADCYHVLSVSMGWCIKKRNIPAILTWSNRPVLEMISLDDCSEVNCSRSTRPPSLDWGLSFPKLSDCLVLEKHVSSTFYVPPGIVCQCLCVTLGDIWRYWQRHVQVWCDNCCGSNETGKNCCRKRFKEIHGPHQAGIWEGLCFSCGEVHKRMSASFSSIGLSYQKPWLSNARVPTDLWNSRKM